MVRHRSTPIINHTLANHAQQASESRLYTFSQETKDALRKFRLSTSRAKDPQAIICELPPEDLPLKQKRRNHQKRQNKRQNKKQHHQKYPNH